MPRKSKKPCGHPGCPNLTDGLYCEQHKHLYPDRASREIRGYTARWKKVRAIYLRKHPLCVKYLANGRYVQATVVDHIISHRGDQSLMWDESNSGWKYGKRIIDPQKLLPETWRRLIAEIIPETAFSGGLFIFGYERRGLLGKNGKTTSPQNSCFRLRTTTSSSLILP